MSRLKVDGANGLRKEEINGQSRIRLSQNLGHMLLNGAIAFQVGSAEFDAGDFLGQARYLELLYGAIRQWIGQDKVLDLSLCAVGRKKCRERICSELDHCASLRQSAVKKGQVLANRVVQFGVGIPGEIVVNDAQPGGLLHMEVQRHVLIVSIKFEGDLGE